MQVIQTEWTEEEAAIRDSGSVNSFTGDRSSYSDSDVDGMSLDYFTEDAVSCAAGHPAMFGHPVLRAWHERRTSGYKMNVHAKTQFVNIVGDLCIMGGIFRISRNPQDGVPGVEHAGRFLSVMKRGADGKWRTWRDMDTPSPDAEELYTAPVDVSLGWVRAPLPKV